MAQSTGRELLGRSPPTDCVRKGLGLAATRSPQTTGKWALTPGASGDRNRVPCVVRLSRMYSVTLLIPQAWGNEYEEEKRMFLEDRHNIYNY